MASRKAKREISKVKKMRWELPKIVKLGKIQNASGGT